MGKMLRFDSLLVHGGLEPNSIERQLTDETRRIPRSKAL